MNLPSCLPIDITYLNTLVSNHTAICEMATIETPLGEMLAVFSAQNLCLLAFVDQKGLSKELASIVKTKQSKIIWQPESLAVERLTTQLAAYFSGKLQRFSIKLDMMGTDFQQKVWQSLLSVPYGQTISYQQQAMMIDRPKAVRAVANANGCNKISILVPCHRVIGSNGRLTGYTGGIDRKKALLSLEKNFTSLFEFEIK